MWFVILLIASAGAATLAYRTYAPFGGRSAQGAWRKSKNYQGEVFVNQLETDMTMNRQDALALLKAMARRDTLRRPTVALTPQKPDIAALMRSTTPQVVWLGHSTTLIRIGGKTLLTDPILSRRASPFQFAGPKRTISSLPITVEDLPAIDAVLISHDHYDHLDYGTIKKLQHTTGKFFVPLGVGAHLRSWGVPDEQIIELDWWDTVTFEGLKFSCTPSRHFSGRTLTDRFKTLWCSWAVRSSDTSVFFSGDTGYGPHFKQIGKKYGPFDITLMECGQYDDHWAHIHMTPEQTVAAHQDLKGKRLLPVHWGAFALALHSWTDSIERVTAAAPTGTHIATPRIGEPVPIKGTRYPKSAWWKNQ